MDRHLIKIVWAAVVTAILARMIMFMASRPPMDARFFVVMSIFGLSLAALAYVSVRTIMFHRHLRRFLQNLMEGRYETGIQVYPHLHDEYAQIEKLANRLGDQLRTYDRLRARHVAFNRHALELVLRVSRDPVMLFNAESNSIELNPAFVKAWEVGESTFTLNALAALPANADFISLLRRSVEKDKVPATAEVALALAPSGAVRRVTATVHPIEDAEERVTLAVVTVAAV